MAAAPLVAGLLACCLLSISVFDVEARVLHEEESTHPSKYIVRAQLEFRHLGHRCLIIGRTLDMSNSFVRSWEPCVVCSFILNLAARPN